MRYEPSSNRQAGFTLVEALVALATMALLSAAALPKMEKLFSQSAVKSARSTITAEFQLARLVATQSGRTAILRVSGDRIWVEARPRTTAAFGSTTDTMGTVNDLYNRHTVAVSTSIDSVVFTPQGLAARGGTIVVQRSSAADSVIVNDLGLVTR
jgi:type II secretion system protein H